MQYPGTFDLDIAVLVIEIPSPHGTNNRILVLNGYCNSAKQPINQEEVYSTEAKDFEKTTPGL